MRYEVRIEPKAAKQLAKIDATDRKRIVAKLDVLRISPYPAGTTTKTLKGSTAYRLRIGDYRVMYLIEEEIKIVTVTRIAKRDEVYKR